MGSVAWRSELEIEGIVYRAKTRLDAGGGYSLELEGSTGLVRTESAAFAWFGPARVPVLASEEARLAASAFVSSVVMGRCPLPPPPRGGAPVSFGGQSARRVLAQAPAGPPVSFWVTDDGVVCGAEYEGCRGEVSGTYRERFSAFAAGVDTGGEAGLGPRPRERVVAFRREPGAEEVVLRERGIALASPEDAPGIAGRGLRARPAAELAVAPPFFVDEPERLVATLRHRGSPLAPEGDIGHLVEGLQDSLSARGLRPRLLPAATHLELTAQGRHYASLLGAVELVFAREYLGGRFSDASVVEIGIPVAASHPCAPGASESRDELARKGARSEAENAWARYELAFASWLAGPEREGLASRMDLSWRPRARHAVVFCTGTHVREALSGYDALRGFIEQSGCAIAGAPGMKLIVDGIYQEPPGPPSVLALYYPVHEPSPAREARA